MSTQEVKIRLALDGAGQLKTGVDGAAASLEKLGQAGAKVGQQTQLSGQQIAQVSAQLQDLFIQIQAGGSPMTALLQQGSQLSAVFGGVGNAISAVTSLITPAVVGLGALAAAVGGAALAYSQGSSEQDAYRRAIILTGNAAGVTAAELQRLAAAQDKQFGTQAQAAEVLAQLASSGKVAADLFGRATDAALRFQAAGGAAAADTVKKLTELGKAPVDALLKLDEAEGFLTKSLLERVKALQQSGQATEAARVAQEGYLGVLDGRGKELEQGLGSIERAWLGVKKVSAEAWSAMLNIGRPSDPIAQAEAAVEAARQAASSIYRNDTDRQRLVEAEAYLQDLRKQDQIKKDMALADAKALADERERRKLAESNTQWLGQAKRLAKELADAQEEGQRRINQGLITQRDLEERLASIRDKYRDRGAEAAAKSAQREREQELQREAVALEKLRGLSGTYFRDLALLRQLRAKDLITEQEYLKAYDDLARQQPVNVQLEKQQADARKASAAALKELLDADAKYIDSLNRSAASAQEQVQRLRDEEKAAGIAATGNVTLAQAIQMVGMARIEEAKAAATARGEFDTAAALERELAARRGLITLIGSADARKAGEKAAEDAVKAWERGIADVERSLVDSLMRGGRSVADYLEDLFRTLVLRPVIQPIAGFIANGATSLLGGLLGGLGIPGIATAASGAVGAGANGASGLSSLLGLGGLASQAGGIGQAIAAGFMNTIGGGTLAGGQAAGLLAGGASTGTGFAGLLGAALPWVGGAALIGNALGLFRSTKTVGSGVTGDLGGTVQDFEVRRKGGSLFSGPSYSTPTIGVSSFNADLQKTFDALRQNAAGFAGILGLDAEAARRFTTPIGSEKLSDDTGGIGIRLEGLSADEVAKKIEAELTAANERLARAVLGTAADAFTKTGETASQTLERLAGSLQGVNGVLDALGQAALQASAQGGAYASALLDQFGSLQQFQSAAGQYLQDYYSQAERSALATQGLSQQLGSLGLSVPASRDAYRQLVEAQDLSTESGRKAYAVLLQLAPTFAELVPAVEGLGQAAQEAARLAQEAAERQAEAGRRVLQNLSRDAAQLEADLLQAQGDTAGATRLRRNAELAEMLEGLSAADTAAATAAFNLNSALRDQIAATEDAARKAQAFQDALSGLGDSRFDLEQQLRRLNGQDAQAAEAQRLRDLARLTAGMTAEQAAQIAAAYDYNLSLQAQVKATEDAQRAAEQLAADQTKAADQAQQAAERIRDSWKSVTDSLFEEAARIRGLPSGGGAEDFASAQRRFAITTAQARANDQEAAKLLPGLGRTLAELAEANATSLIDLKRIRAQIAASLEQTGSGLAGSYGLNIPKLATGTNLVPKDMLALLHEGEAVVPRAFNPAAGGQSSDSALVTEVRGLREENKVQALAIVRLQTEMNKLLKRWDTDGIPEERATA